MNNLITFYEHELIPFEKLRSSYQLPKDEVVEVFKTINKNNSNKEDESNNNEEKEINGLFRIYYNGIKAKQYVGFVAIKDMTIQVLPKVFKECGHDENSKILAFIRMMNHAYNLNIKEDELAKLTSNNSPSSIYEIFIYLFANSLLKEIEKGFYRKYVKVRKEEKFLKGKLLVDKQIKKLPHQRHKFSIEYNEFTENNLLNQIFYYTTYISMKKTNWQDNKKLLAKLMLIFEDINLRKISSHDFKRVHFTRLNERFKKSFSLAKIILSTFGAVEGEDTVGFFVDMNELFEKFICSILSRNLDFEVRYQNKFQIFKKEGLEGIKNIDQKPDYVIYKDNKPILVLDAKYREINKENGKITISTEILRQIYTYAKIACYNNEKVDKLNTALIFPKSKKYNNFNNKSKIGEATFFDGDIKLYVLTYNLEGLIDGYGIDMEFLEEVKRIKMN